MTTAVKESDTELDQEVESLISAARAGDAAAFAALHRRYVRLVHALLLARVPFGAVDDLLQDVFLHAWRKLATLRDPQLFGSWLATIARNRAADFHRREQPPETIPLSEWHGRTRPESLTASGVLEAIRSLPDAYRETLLLRLVEGLTGPEIAEQTGLTPDSVRVNLHRGMKLLRERIR